MPEWRKICCAVDFSEASRVALDTAAELAGRLKAELWVVHVAHASAGGALLGPPERHQHPASHGSADLRAWTSDAQLRAGGLAMSVELAGDAASEITRFAREFGCDLIVVGTHGRKGLRRATLGSVAETVVRSAPCQVLVARRLETR